MGKLFGPDSILFAFLTKIADLIILNVLWIIGCIPSVTIGASTIIMGMNFDDAMNDDIKVMLFATKK